MKNKGRWVLAGILLVVVVIVLRERLRQPWFHGKPLSAWLARYGDGPRGYTPSPEADDALRHIGARAVPHLLELLRATNSPSVAKLIPTPATNPTNWPVNPMLNSRWRRLLARWTPIRFHPPTPASWKHWQAYVGFQKLGPLGESAIPDLVTLARDPSATGNLQDVQTTLAIKTMAALADNSGSYMAPYDSGLLGSVMTSGPQPRPTIFWGPGRSTNSFLSDGEIAAWSLAAIGAVPALMELLNDPNPVLKTRATVALGMVGGAAEPAVPALVLDLKSPDRGVRLRAAESLGWIGRRPKQVVPALTEALQDREMGVKHHAAEALGRFGDRATNALPALLENFSDRDYRVRQSAAAALNRISPELAAKEIAPVLVRRFDDARFRNEAVILLSQMRLAPETLIPLFTRALNDGDDSVRMNAMRVLGGFGVQSKEAVPRLVALSADNNLFVRQQATNALDLIQPGWRSSHE